MITLDNTTRYMGKSTDTKPEVAVKENDLFLELDTGDVYYWDGEQWSKVGGE